MSEVAKINTMGITAESVLIDGDLSKLSAEQRVIHYKNVCDSLGLNYLTKPFAYIRLNGKLTFYALKDCTEQLRNRDGVSIHAMNNQLIGDVYVVTAYARTKDGKEDVATGAVPVNGLKGEALANAYMKAETKAKRRVTLSICGLGITDEEEISSIPKAQKVEVNSDTGEIIETTMPVFKAGDNVVLPVKTNEEVLAEISVPRQELINGIMESRNMDELKNAYARAYVCHANRLEIMKDITDMKDMRKKQLMTFNEAVDKALFDEDVPDLTKGAA